MTNAILLHHDATFGDVTGNRRIILHHDAAGEPESEKLLILRRRNGSFGDVTRSRSRVRAEILSAIFDWNSSGENCDVKSSDLAVSLIHCFELLAYVFKREAVE